MSWQKANIKGGCFSQVREWFYINFSKSRYPARWHVFHKLPKLQFENVANFVSFSL